MDKPGHSSVGLPIQGQTHLKKCFRQRTEGQGRSGVGADMVMYFVAYLTTVSSPGYIVSYKTMITK
jgi:hypothetical protein